jgi:alpha-L-rhamnosidase
MTKLFALTTFLAVVLTAPQSRRSDLVVDDLRCEYALNPMGVDVRAPRLFWKLKSDVGGARQTAYQIVVGSSRDALARDQGDLWDSGRVASDETTHIPYAGKPLTSTQRVLWKVRVWDGHARPSPWSAAASWTMGLLEPTDWTARWITGTQRIAALSTRVPGQGRAGVGDDPRLRAGPIRALSEREESRR